MTPGQEQRQAARRRGQYARMDPCPRCGRRRALEPAYTTDEGGEVSPESRWAGAFLCLACLRDERGTTSEGG